MSVTKLPNISNVIAEKFPAKLFNDGNKEEILSAFSIQNFGFYTENYFVMPVGSMGMGKAFKHFYDLVALARGR